MALEGNLMVEHTPETGAVQDQALGSWCKARRCKLIAVASVLGLVVIAVTVSIAYFSHMEHLPASWLGCARDPRTLAHWMDHSCSSRQRECHDAYPRKLQCCSESPFADKCLPVKPPSPDLCKGDTGIEALNQTYEASCAEWDNVRIAFKRRAGNDKLPTVVRVTAKHPRYVNATDEDGKEARFCDCSSDGPPIGQPATGAHIECNYSNREFYNDGRVVLKAWCDPSWGYDLMALTDKNGPILNGLHATNVEMYAKIPGTPDFGGVFVLYQNGYSRMLPMVPLKMPSSSWIPFGTSTVLGPSRDGVFPHASITHLELKEVVVEKVSFGVKYAFGNDASEVVLEYTPSRLASTLQLYGISWSDPSLAYIRLSSMYVQPGVSDAEVLLDGKGTPHRLAMTSAVPGADQDAWMNASGPAWFLGKECVSEHNTLAPDMLVELVCAGQEGTEIVF